MGQMKLHLVSHAGSKLREAEVVVRSRESDEMGDQGTLSPSYQTPSAKTARFAAGMVLGLKIKEGSTCRGFES